MIGEIQKLFKSTQENPNVIAALKTARVPYAVALAAINGIVVARNAWDFWTPLTVTAAVGINIAITFVAGTVLCSVLLQKDQEEKVKETNQNSDINDVALLLKATYENDQLGMSSKEFKILNVLSKTQQVVIKEVSSIEDINKAIEQIRQQDKKIKTLWLNAHGTPNKIDLSYKESMIGKDPIHHFYERFSYLFKYSCVDQINFKELTPDANIVVFSCSTGGIPNIVDGLNIAEWIQFYAGPTRKVFAPVIDVSAHRIKQVQIDGQFSYKFSNYQKSADITADISYLKVIKKINASKLPNSWTDRLFSLYRSFDYKSLLKDTETPNLHDIQTIRTYKK